MGKLPKSKEIWEREIELASQFIKHVETCIGNVLEKILRYALFTISTSGRGRLYPESMVVDPD